MPSYITTPSGRQHFVRYAPRRPLAGNKTEDGLKLHAMSKRDALDCSHMQLQPPGMRASIVLDLDHSEARTIIREMDYLTPQLIVYNPRNGHAHPHFQLAEPIAFGENARMAPQRALIDLQRQLSVLYGADRSYSYYSGKTPGHPDHETVETGGRCYSMAELYEAMPAGIARMARQPAPQQVIGEGRHYTLWESGRHWAYRNVKKAKRTGTFEQWKAQVLAEFLALNSYVDASPLGWSQVRSLARRVAEWTWEAGRLGGGVFDWSGRMYLQSEEREAITPEEAKWRQAQGAMHTNALKRNTTHDAITAAIGVLAQQGIMHPTQGQVAAAAGVSRQTVNAYMRREQAGAGN